MKKVIYPLYFVWFLAKMVFFLPVGLYAAGAEMAGDKETADRWFDVFERHVFPR